MAPVARAAGDGSARAESKQSTKSPWAVAGKAVAFRKGLCSPRAGVAWALLVPPPSLPGTTSFSDHAARDSEVVPNAMMLTGMWRYVQACACVGRVCRMTRETEKATL